MPSSCTSDWSDAARRTLSHAAIMARNGDDVRARALCAVVLFEVQPIWLAGLAADDPGLGTLCDEIAGAPMPDRRQF